MKDAILYLTEVSLPPGKYVISDPCYHVPEDQWDHVLNASGCFGYDVRAGRGNGMCWSRFPKNYGTEGFVAAFVVRWGDGEYYDQFGKEYGVDSGHIGIIPLDDCTFDPTLGHIVEFKEQFLCREEGGVIQFGHIVIDTNSDAEDEEIFEDGGPYVF